MNYDSPKVCTECELLQFGGCRQVQSVTFIAKTECLGDPAELRADGEKETKINDRMVVNWEGQRDLGVHG